MKFRRSLYIGLVLVVAVGVAAVIYLQRSLPDIARDVVQHRVPGSDFADLDVGFTQAAVRDLSFVDADREMRAIVSRVEADFDLLSAFGDELRVREVRVVGPHIEIRRSPRPERDDDERPEVRDDDEEEAAEAEAVERERTERAAAADRRDPQSIRIGRVEVRDGSLRIIDARDGVEPFPEIVLTDIRLDASDLTHPLRPGRVPVDLSATIAATSPGQMRMRGWIDRPAEAGDVTVTADSVPLDLLSAYQDDNAPNGQAVRGSISLDARVAIDDREFRIQGSASLSELVVLDERARVFGMPANLVGEYLEEHDGSVEVDFDVSGNLDEHDPRERLAQGIATALVLKVGSEQAAPLFDRLREGDIEGAEREYRELRDALRQRLRQAE